MIDPARCVKISVSRSPFPNAGTQTHLSQLEGSGTREGAPEVHRGQKVCTTGAFVLVLIHKLSTRADARWRLGRQREVELFEQEFVIGFWMGVAA